MKNTIEIKLLILTIIFSCTSAFVYGMNQSTVITTKRPLSKQLLNIPGYTLIRPVKLEPDALRMLKLDDYLFADYKGPGGKVNLYIGYYYSAAKAYASHSPLVCYPSQGWKITSKAQKSTLELPPATIHYEEITTSFGEQKELVLFWYQSRLLTATQIYKNKINMGYNKLAHNYQQHSFIRIAVPFADSSYKEAKTTAIAFIQAFYPQYIHFILAKPN
jgi:EpsI family protein